MSIEGDYNLKELTRRQREQQEKEDVIISKAEELFCKYGFEKVSMDTLAKESEFTKRTIYRYFTSKEDLFFAVALRGYTKLFDMVNKKSIHGKTGFEKIRLSYYAYYEYFCKYPKLAQLINLGGSIKSSCKDTDVPFRQKFMELDKQLFEKLISGFIEGKSDRSIRADLDIKSLALSSIYVAVGFFQIISVSGNTFTKHFELDKDEFIKFTIERLLEPLKNKTNSEWNNNHG